MSPFFSTWSKRDDAVIHLGADHAVAHGGVDGVGEVDGGGSGGQVLHVAVGGEHEHLVGEHIHLQGVDKLLGVGALLIFQQTADPLVACPRCRRPGRSACTSSGRPRRTRRSRASPWCGSAPQRGCPSLPDDGGVKALVAVGLGGADIVLEPAQNGLVEVVDHAQHVVAVADGVHHHPEGEEVEDLIQRSCSG